MSDVVAVFRTTQPLTQTAGREFWAGGRLEPAGARTYKWTTGFDREVSLMEGLTIAAQDVERIVAGAGLEVEAMLELSARQY